MKHIVLPIFYNKNANSRLKKIPDKMIKRIEGEIKALLHSERDALRNKKINTSEIRFDCNNAYHGEAFGIMRGLHLLGYGYFGSSNLDASIEKQSNVQPICNLRWWFCQLEQEVLEEEGYYTDGHCEYCFLKYKKDAASSLISSQDSRISRS